MVAALPVVATTDALTDIPWATQTPIDWEIVAAMRGSASTRMSNRIGSDRLDADHQQSLGRAIIADLLDERASSSIAQGLSPWDPAYQARMGQAVFDALFRLGRLQALVDDETIENIVISGADNVWLETSDGRIRPGPPVADSDQELVDFLSFIASRSEVNERSFSPAEPRLHLRLDSGARLAAAAWVTPRPSVVIRRHRLQEVTIADMFDRRCVSLQMSRFLTEAVRRRASIVVSGAQGAGKTTLMRALCSAIPPDEVIGTFETEYELHLHLMPERHHIVHAWEARPGSGETDANGRRAGEFLLDDALYDSFRFNLSRQIVGEVRGREILAMLKAMQSGSGSLSTTHSHSAEGAIRKLITCAMEAGPHVTSQYATRAIAEDIDFIVHMEMRTYRTRSGEFRRQRWVKEILALEPSDSVRGYATTRLFSTLPGETLAGMETCPDGYLDVFDPMEEMWNLSWP
ncbi:MAG: CpaF/VirB11 family protein [Propionibacteriaceae bacterium]|nr:CpaF/VirB11 family protein [Propionibacteriaceae bacterium]